MGFDPLGRKGGHRIEHTIAVVNANGLYNLLTSISYNNHKLIYYS